MDASFFFSNARKLADGGWFPLAIATAVLAAMHTWKTGRDAVFRLVYGDNVTEAELRDRPQLPCHAGPGRGGIHGRFPQGTPVALLHHVKANRCLHKKVILLCIVTEDMPAVPENARLDLRELGAGIWRANGHYGYMESPDVATLVEQIKAAGLKFNPQGATYFFNREMILHGGNSGMWEWEKSFYGFLSRNARPAKDYYKIPPSQIIEIGLPLQL